MDILSEIRESTKKVTEQAKFVSLNYKKLKELTENLNSSKIKKFYRYEGDFYFIGKNEELLNYIITLNAMNFGSGLSEEWKEKRKYKESSFKSIALALKKEVEKENVLDVNFAKNANRNQISKFLGLNPDFQLILMFEKSLNELGDFVLKNYGNYKNLINSLNSKTKANDLSYLLFSNLSSYSDRAKYQGLDIYFLKRAQILANDLYLAFKGKDFGEMGDISKLTMFADNLVPHFFRIEGVVEYKKNLLEKIEKGIKIQAGSEEEVEIRAFGVQCVEKLKELLNDKDLCSAQIDWYIWEKAQDPKYKSVPRHKTVTYFY